MPEAPLFSRGSSAFYRTAPEAATSFPQGPLPLLLSLLLY